jgi:hypothetical protein
MAREKQQAGATSDAREQELEASRNVWLASRKERQEAANQKAEKAAASAREEMAKPKKDRQ